MVKIILSVFLLSLSFLFSISPVVNAAPLFVRRFGGETDTVIYLGSLDNADADLYTTIGDVETSLPNSTYNPNRWVLSVILVPTTEEKRQETVKYIVDKGKKWPGRLFWGNTASGSRVFWGTRLYVRVMDNKMDFNLYEEYYNDRGEQLGDFDYNGWDTALPYDDESSHYRHQTYEYCNDILSKTHARMYGQDHGVPIE